MANKEKSPLERLVEIQQSQSIPIKMQPKSKLKKKSEPIVPLIESDTRFDPFEKITEEVKSSKLAISNSSLVVNLNLNIDSDVMDKAIEESLKVAKKLAAAGAAVIGTAILLSNESKTPKKIKIPLKPKIKVPKFDS